MKKVLCLLIIMSVPVFLFAEPLTLQQAGNVLQPGTLEFGLSDIAYQTDLTKLTDSAGTVLQENTITSTILPISGRYAFNEKWEGTLAIPYISNTQKLGSASTSTTGMGDALAGIKYSRNKTENKINAVSLLFSLPTGAADFRKGLDIKPVWSHRKIKEKRAFNINIAYNLTAEYNDANSVKQNPGNILSFGMSAERMRTEKLTTLCEFEYRSLSEATSAGASVADSAGTQMDITLGARYNKGDWKSKLGVSIALGDETYRTYDYKVILGVTRLFKLGGI